METIVVRGQTYRLGDGPASPLALSAILPAPVSGFHEVDGRPWSTDREYGRAYAQHPGGLRICVTASIEADRKRWLHVSVSHRGGRLPTWREMCEVKDTFCGPERTAYQVHPPTDKHVSIHHACLHLFCPLDGSVTPDFTRGGETI